MKKHIFGLTLFSFIVGATAIIYVFYDTSESVEISSANITSANESYAAPIKVKKIEDDSSIIKHAKFDLNLKIIYLTLDMNKLYENDYEVKNLRFSFFDKKTNQAKFIALETHKYIPQSKFYGEAGDEIVSFQCDWLKKLNAHSQLFVIVEAVSEHSDLPTQTVFNDVFAHPVILSSEKETKFQGR